MSGPVLLLGAGGHAKVLIEALRAAGVTIAGILEANHKLVGSTVSGISVLSEEKGLLDFPPAQIRLVNGVGSIRSTELRRKVFQRFHDLGYRFAVVVHPSAVVASDVVLEEGAQVMAGCVLQPGCRIGFDAIVNTRASLDHDCFIGPHAHIAPGVTLSGAVTVGEAAHVGTGATVIQGIEIGAASLVAAGSVVVRDVTAHTTVRGVPAKVVE